MLRQKVTKSKQCLRAATLHDGCGALHLTTGRSIIKIKYKSIKFACLNACLLAFTMLSCLRSSKRKARVRTGKSTASETSNAGLQYHRGRVGRGVQPRSTPQPQPPHTQASRTLVFPLFDSITIDGLTDQRADGWTDRQMDKASYRFRD